MYCTCTYIQSLYFSFFLFVFSFHRVIDYSGGLGMEMKGAYSIGKKSFFFLSFFLVVVVVEYSYIISYHLKIKLYIFFALKYLKEKGVFIY